MLLLVKNSEIKLIICSFNIKYQFSPNFTISSTNFEKALKNLDKRVSFSQYKSFIIGKIDSTVSWNPIVFT